MPATTTQNTRTSFPTSLPFDLLTTAVFLDNDSGIARVQIIEALHVAVSDADRILAQLTGKADEDILLSAGTSDHAFNNADLDIHDDDVRARVLDATNAAFYLGLVLGHRLFKQDGVR